MRVLALISQYIIVCVLNQCCGKCVCVCDRRAIWGSFVYNLYVMRVCVCVYVLYIMVLGRFGGGGGGWIDLQLCIHVCG